MSVKTIDLSQVKSGSKEYPKLSPFNILTVMDEGHFMYGKVNSLRYDSAGPFSTELLDLASFMLNNIKAPPNSQAYFDIEHLVVWFLRGKYHVLSGNRRTVASRIAISNMQPAPDKIAVPYLIADIKTDLELLQAEQIYKDANNGLPNDLLTVIYACDRLRNLGYSYREIYAVWPQLGSPHMIEKCLNKDIGILKAHPALHAVLSTNAITLTRALKIAAVKPIEKQARILQGEEEVERREYGTGPLTTKKVLTLADKLTNPREKALTLAIGGNFEGLSKFPDLKNIIDALRRT